MVGPAARRLLWRAGVPAVLILVLDGVTKQWAAHALAAGHVRQLFGGALTLQLVINHGAAFGLGSAHPAVVTALASVALIALVGWTARLRHRGPALAAGLMLGGAAGNLLDRFDTVSRSAQHGVVDWIHVAGYPPTFNLADVSLRAGVLVALLVHLRRGRAAGRSARATRATLPQARVTPAPGLDEDGRSCGPR